MLSPSSIKDGLTLAQLRALYGLDSVYAVPHYSRRPPCVLCGKVPTGGFSNTVSGMFCHSCLYGRFASKNSKSSHPARGMDGQTASGLHVVAHSARFGSPQQRKQLRVCINLGCGQPLPRYAKRYCKDCRERRRLALRRNYDKRRNRLRRQRSEQTAGGLL